MTPPLHRIFEPAPPAALAPFRRIVWPLAIVQTAPCASTICAAVGTTVPSGDVPVGADPAGARKAVPVGVGAQDVDGTAAPQDLRARAAGRAGAVPQDRLAIGD